MGKSVWTADETRLDNSVYIAEDIRSIESVCVEALAAVYGTVEGVELIAFVGGSIGQV